MSLLRYSFLLLLTALGSFPVVADLAWAVSALSYGYAANTAATTCRVTARIELLNLKVKDRRKADAGGVVVWLDPLDGPAPRAQRPRQRMDQRGKRFIPHVVAVQRGSEVDFPNNDPFFHNVFSLYNGKRFDLGLYASGESRPVLFNRPGVSHIFCNIHPQMSAVVVALDTPYFGVSDRAGNVAVADVPEGRYTLRVWHERTKPAELDALTRQVRITPAAADLGVIRLSEEGYVPQPHPNKHGQDYDNERNRPPYRRP
jgi:plastocyanin